MADFASAQTRILARRATRDRALLSQQTQARNERAGSLLSLPPSLRSFAHQTLNVWDVVKNPEGTRPAFRVGQVDSEILDEELVKMLGKQAGDGLKFFGGGALKEEWGEEISLVLRAIMWKLSVWDWGVSYGGSLQGLRYVDARGRKGRDGDRGWKDVTRAQKGLYGLVTVLGRYLWGKWEERLSALENGYEEPGAAVKRLGQLTTLASSGYNVAAFVSFAVFLFNGRYRTITDRILRMRLVPASNQTSREVSFEYLNRQLVWHAFTEFLLFLLPLVGISRWKRWIARAWKKTKDSVTSLRGNAHTEEDEDELEKRGELGHLPERTCAICYHDQNPAGGQSEQDVISAGANSGIIGNASTDVTNPYQTIECKCIYCFVCIAQRIEAEEGEGWICLRCGEVVKECKPWDGDVLVSESTTTTVSERPSSRKSIAWADELVEERDVTEKMGAGLLRSVDSVVVEEED